MRTSGLTTYKRPQAPAHLGERGGTEGLESNARAWLQSPWRWPSIDTQRESGRPGRRLLADTGAIIGGLVISLAAVGFLGAICLCVTAHRPL